MAEELRVGRRPTDDEMAAIEARERKVSERIRELMWKDPSLPFISAHVIASDQVGAEEWELEARRRGKEPADVVWMVGSYARFDYALKHCTPEWVFKHLPELWRGSDPDDTSSLALTTWRWARKHVGHYLRDGKALPRSKFLTVYRGQLPGEAVGIAWSLDRATADKFARGAGIRTGSMPGVVLETVVERADVLGYMTGRGEAEVIIDPRGIVTRTIQSYTKASAKAETDRLRAERFTGQDGDTNG